MQTPNDCKTPFDAYSPREMACRAKDIGVTKSRLDFLSTFMLAVLAGAFIGLGACFYTTVTTGVSAGLGFTRLVGSVCFCLGLILVIVGGAELFTGNVLIVIAFISGRVRFRSLMRNWAIVYAGNLVGSVVTAAIVYYAWQWKMGGMGVGATAYSIAGSKMSAPFGVVFCSGIMCNALVCMAVWLCYSARSTTDKILSIIFPVTAFVTLGFEHSVANMYFVPYGMMLAKTSAFMSDPGAAAVIAKYPVGMFTASDFLVRNLIPATLGNIVGGAVMVGIVYWMIYLRTDGRAVEAPAVETAGTSAAVK